MSTLCGCCQTIWQEGAPTGNPDDDAVAGGPASQMVCQVLLPVPSFSLSWFLPAGPSHTFTAKADVQSVCFLLGKAHLLVCRVARGVLPRARAPRNSSSHSARGTLPCYLLK